MTVQPLTYPTDYTSRDFFSIRQDLIAAVQSRIPTWVPSDSDFGLALIEALAMASDVAHYYIDRLGEEAFLSTAQQRSSVLAIASMLGYTPAVSAPSTVTFSVTNTAYGSSVTLPAGSLIDVYLSGGTGSPIVLPFETNSSITVGPSSAPTVLTVLATQGQTISGEVLGVASGFLGDEFTLSQFPVIQNTATLSDGTNTWTYVSRLTDHGPTEKVFSLRAEDNGQSTVVFGDSAAGAIPAAGVTLTATYRVGGGTQGNISAAAAPGAVIRVANPTDIGRGTLSVTISGAATGGVDDESIDSIKINAPLVFSTQNRAVTLNDYNNLALATPNIYLANAVSSVYSSVTCYVAPLTPGSGLPGIASGSYGAYTYNTAMNTAISGVGTSLNSKCPAGTTVSVYGYQPVFVALGGTITLSANTRWSQYLIGLNQALGDLLRYENSDFGLLLQAGQIFAAIYGVSGTTNLNLTIFDRYNAAGTPATTYAAGGTITALANEVLMLEYPAAGGSGFPGVSFTLTGGINDL